MSSTVFTLLSKAKAMLLRNVLHVFKIKTLFWGNGFSLSDLKLDWSVLHKRQK